ncbi:unnamed protein product, partial [Discosporangium mesarthrocarpum]
LSIPRVNSTDGMTALAAAVSRGHTACARVLLSRGADPTIRTHDGRTPVYLAAAGGHLAALGVLLDALPPTRWKEARGVEAEGRTPVMVAAANGHLECLALL